MACIIPAKASRLRSVCENPICWQNVTATPGLTVMPADCLDPVAQAALFNVADDRLTGTAYRRGIQRRTAPT
jgi:hypothetical protein